MSGGTQRYNENSMANTLPSSESTKRDDQCCGIHGAARRRKGAKHGAICALRRHSKKVIQEGLEEVNE